MKDLNKLYCECIKELDSIGVKYGNIVSVVVNTRAKKRWGQCKIVRNASCWADRRYEISVSSRLLEDNIPDKGTKETIIHEILHSCYGSNNHGPEWKNNVNLVNHKLGYNIKKNPHPKIKVLLFLRQYRNTTMFLNVINVDSL